MSHRFSELMFTPTVKAVQERMGSRGAYERLEEPDAPARDRFTEGERAFIAARDSFYLATVSETGWPYVQHRGGPSGFLKVLDERTLGCADYKGNRQYVSVGNLITDDRVSLFLVDHPNRRRLKILGHAFLQGLCLALEWRGHPRRHRSRQEPRRTDGVGSPLDPRAVPDQRSRSRLADRSRARSRP